MKLSRCFFLVSLFTLFLQSAAFAFNQANQWKLGLGGGVAFLSSRHHVNHPPVALLNAGYNLTDRWGVQGMVAFFSTNSTRASIKDQHVSGNFYAFDVLYHASPWHQFQPYAALGPSVVSLNPNGSDANNEGGLNGALGTEWFAGKRMALYLELRDFYTMVGGKNDVFPNAGLVFLW